MKLKSLLLFAILAVAPTLYGGVVTGNLQGPSGLPVKNATLTFTLQQAGLIIGSGNVAQLTSQCWTSQDGSVVGLPNPMQPATVAVGPTATLPSGIYYVRFTFYNSLGESLPSPETHIQTTTLTALLVSPPVTFPANATGINVYIGTSAGSETLQGSTTSPTQQYSQTTPLNSGGTPPGANTAPCTIAFNDTIIPYGGYNVSLTSATGNAYPGWPQAWQLNGGPSGTINVSSGAPLWNGTVVYPMPILSQPLNHGPQSISGPLDFGGYDVTNIGVLTANSVNGVVNPVIPQAGVDLGAAVNNALATCADQCTILLPSGSFSYSTQIVLPQNIFGQYKLSGQPGTVLTWNGSTDAIVTRPVTIGASNLTIEGFQLINAGSGTTAGIHLYPTNHVIVQNMVVQGFTDGVLVEGTNSSDIVHNDITNNVNGVRLISTFCSATPNATCVPTNLSGTLFAANAINIDHNQITNNQHWGVIFGDSPGNGDSGALNDNVSFNDLEQNGTGGSTFGALYSGKSTGLLVFHNYLEGSPREIVLGLLGAGNFFGTVGAHITSNFYTTLPSPLYNIELQNADRTTIDSNTEQGGAGVSSTNCFINVGGVETNTILIPNSIVQSPPNGNRLCSVGTPIQTFAGAGSWIAFNNNYMAKIAAGAFPITAGASDTQASVNVATSSSCFAYSTANGSQATAQGLIAQVYVKPGNGSFTIFHPTGNAGLLYDVYCTGPQN